MTNEIYISTDVEADGPVPGKYSLLSLGSAAFSVDKNGVELIDQFSANLELLPGALQDADTMNFWRKNPEAWQAGRENLIRPAMVMSQYVQWLNQLPGKGVFIAWPATYDFMFTYWYLVVFTGESPFKWSGCDAKTYFMAMKKQRWLDTHMAQLSKLHPVDNPLPHVAINDAIQQGWQACYMIHANLFGV